MKMAIAKAVLRLAMRLTGEETSWGDGFVVCTKKHGPLIVSMAYDTVESEGQMDFALFWIGGLTLLADNDGLAVWRGHVPIWEHEGGNE